MPLPWILGPLALSSILSAFNQKITIPEIMYKISIAVIGVSLGSNFSPEIFLQMKTWFLSIFILLIFITLLTLIITSFLKKNGYDFTTSFFSALPAGLTESTSIGLANGGKGEVIALCHTIRVVMIAFTIPFTITYLTNFDGDRILFEEQKNYGLYEYIILFLSGIIGLWLGKVLKIPAGSFVVPFFISAIIHISSISLATPPNYFLIAAQIILGTKIGTRFKGIKFPKTKKTILLSIIITSGSILFCFLAAFILGKLFKIDPILLLLAITPGGVTEMSLISLSLGQDVSFVTTHHIIRISTLLLIAPFIYAFLKRSTSKNQE